MFDPLSLLSCVDKLTLLLNHKSFGGGGEVAVGSSNLAAGLEQDAKQKLSVFAEAAGIGLNEALEWAKKYSEAKNVDGTDGKSALTTKIEVAQKADLFLATFKMPELDKLVQFFLKTERIY